MDVAEHFRFRVVSVEDRMRQVSAGAIGDLSVFLHGQIFNLELERAASAERVEQVLNIFLGGGFIQRHADRLCIDDAQVDVVGFSPVLQSGTMLAAKVDAESVEETVASQLIAE